MRWDHTKIRLGKQVAKDVWVEGFRTKHSKQDAKHVLSVDINFHCFRRVALSVRMAGIRAWVSRHLVLVVQQARQVLLQV